MSDSVTSSRPAFWSGRLRYVLLLLLVQLLLAAGVYVAVRVLDGPEAAEIPVPAQPATGVRGRPAPTYSRAVALLLPGRRAAGAAGTGH